MGLPRLGGQGGNGGDVWVVAAKNMTLRRVKDKYPKKRFIGRAGTNSRLVPPYMVLILSKVQLSSSVYDFIFFDSVRSLKGERGEDQEILAPVGVSVTTDDGRVLGKSEALLSCSKFTS